MRRRLAVVEQPKRVIKIEKVKRRRKLTDEEKESQARLEMRLFLENRLATIKGPTYQQYGPNVNVQLPSPPGPSCTGSSCAPQRANRNGRALGYAASRTAPAR